VESRAAACSRRAARHPTQQVQTVGSPTVLSLATVTSRHEKEAPLSQFIATLVSLQSTSFSCYFHTSYLTMSAEEVAKAFVQHFYQAFDTNVDSLAGLFVSQVSVASIDQHWSLVRLSRRHIVPRGEVLLYPLPWMSLDMHG
jgi:hypothetical protein